MSNQFELENAIREATRMDTSISKTGWNKPRKALENTNTSLNISVGRWNYISCNSMVKFIVKEEDVD